MPRDRLYDVLEECLVQLKKGDGLEVVLAQHKELANKLRPLLEAAVLAQPGRAQAPGLNTAQNRSRARFLGAASQRKPVSVLGTLKFAGMRLAAAVVLVVVIFTASLVGSGLASAKAVPGQALYPVKRAVEQAQLVLTTSQINKIELEESFDQRRAQETEELIHTGQSEKVQFAGFLREDPQAGWVVDQSVLILTSDQEDLAKTLDGSYVEVSGMVKGEAGVQVSNLQLRIFQLDGLLVSIQPDEWVVSGIRVQIQDSTKVMGKPKLGAKVEISALRLGDGQFLALSAKIKQSGSPKNDDEDKKDDNEKESGGDNPEPEATVQSGDDEHGGGNGKSNEDPTSEPDTDADSNTESSSEPESMNNSNAAQLTEDTESDHAGETDLKDLTNSEELSAISMAD